MTFISGARITEKRHNGAGWHSWLSKQMSLQTPLKRVQWQAAVTQCWWQTVPHCGPVEGEATLAHRRLYTLGRSTHPVDADCSWGHPWTFSTGTQNSCRYGCATPWMHFHTRTAVLKMILHRINPAVGCIYFPPCLQLPSQPQGITALRPVPNYTAWWQRRTGVNNLSKYCAVAPGGNRTLYTCITLQSIHITHVLAVCRRLSIFPFMFCYKLQTLCAVKAWQECPV